MDVTVNTSLLAQELKLLDKIVQTKNTNPVLANILLRADDQLYLSATDTEVGLSTQCNSWIAAPGTTTLPAKKFLAIIDQLPDADVQITLEGNAAKIKCGQFTSRLQTWRAEDFPNLPAMEGDAFSLPAPMLRQVIERTRYAIAEKGEQRAMSCAMLSVLDKVLTLVATDGKRLSVATITGVESAPVTALLPMKTMDILKTLNTDGTVEFSRSERHLFFKMGDRLLTSRMSDGQFPNYQRAIPKEGELDQKATIGRSLFAASLRRVGLVSDDTTQAMTFLFSPGQVEIKSQSAQVGDAVEFLSIAYEGPEIKVTTNWRMLLDFLEVATGKTIDVGMKAGENQGRILLTDGDNFINVVLLLK